MKFKATKQEAQLKPGLYPAKFQMVDEKTGTYGPYLIWTFELQHKGRHLSYLTSTNFSSGSKARQVVEALIGRFIMWWVLSMIFHRISSPMKPVSRWGKNGHPALGTAFGGICGTSYTVSPPSNGGRASACFG